MKKKNCRIIPCLSYLIAITAIPLLGGRIVDAQQARPWNIGRRQPLHRQHYTRPYTGDSTISGRRYIAYFRQVEPPGQVGWEEQLVLLEFAEIKRLAAGLEQSDKKALESAMSKVLKQLKDDWRRYDKIRHDEQQRREDQWPEVPTHVLERRNWRSAVNKALEKSGRAEFEAAELNRFQVAKEAALRELIAKLQYRLRLTDKQRDFLEPLIEKELGNGLARDVVNMCGISGVTSYIMTVCRDPNPDDKGVLDRTVVFSVLTPSQQKLWDLEIAEDLAFLKRTFESEALLTKQQSSKPPK